MPKRGSASDVPARPPTMSKSAGKPPEPRGIRRLADTPPSSAVVDGGLQERIRAVVDLYGTRKEAAEVAGRSPETLSNWMKGANAPPFDVIVSLARRKGVRLDWLATGEGPMGEIREGTYSDPVGSNVDEFVYIPRYDVRAGAGNGQIVDTATIKGFLAFREDWVRSRLRRNPAYLVVLEAFGDSMEPTINDGDVMLVDMSETSVRGPAIYAVSVGEATIVKRIELKLDGSLLVKSDNPQYEPITLRGVEIGELRVLGKVVWSGGLV